MNTYRIRNEKDAIINNKLADDIRNGNMSEGRAEKIYSLYRNSHITFEEIREFRGDILIDNRHQSDNPTEDALMKTSFLDTEVEHWQAKSKAAGKEGNTKRREILKEFAEYYEISADKI